MRRLGVDSLAGWLVLVVASVDVLLLLLALLILGKVLLQALASAVLAPKPGEQDCFQVN